MPKTVSSAKSKPHTKAAAAVPKRAAGEPHRLRVPKRPLRRVPKQFRPPRPRLPAAWTIARKAGQALWQHKWLFGGIIIIYGVLNLILVQGVAGGTDVQGVKTILDQVIKGNWAQLGIGLTIFVSLVSSSGNVSSNTAGAYQLFLVLLTSLALIWSLRQVQAGAVPRLRDTFYRGMYPLVPFILVLVIIGLQLLPLIIGTSLYNIVMTNGIAVHAYEKIGWTALAVVLACVSIYWIASSIFALYIVTLPDMTPLKALRSARELVRYRRLPLIRKLLFLPLLLLVGAAIIMLPIIIWVTPLAQWIFFVLTMIAVAVVHGYLYTLYRELLNE